MTFQTPNMVFHSVQGTHQQRRCGGQGRRPMAASINTSLFAPSKKITPRPPPSPRLRSASFTTNVLGVPCVAAHTRQRQGPRALRGSVCRDALASRRRVPRTARRRRGARRSRSASATRASTSRWTRAARSSASPAPRASTTSWRTSRRASRAPPTPSTPARPRLPPPTAAPATRTRRRQLRAVRLRLQPRLAEGEPGLACVD